MGVFSFGRHPLLVFQLMGDDILRMESLVKPRNGSIL